MTRKIYLIISVLLLCFGCYAQNNNPKPENRKMKYSFIYNDKIKYSIVLMTCDTCVPITNIGYRVKVQLNTKEENIVHKISYNTWEELLNDSNRDWAANLILYYLYNKDAFLLSRNNDKELWSKYLKSDDIQFWKKKFQK
jgi:hypothetical protein